MEPRGPSEEEQKRRPDKFPVKGRIQFGQVWPCRVCGLRGYVKRGDRNYPCAWCKGTGFQTRKESNE